MTKRKRLSSISLRPTGRRSAFFTAWVPGRRPGQTVSSRGMLSRSWAERLSVPRRPEISPQNWSSKRVAYAIGRALSVARG